MAQIVVYSINAVQLFFIFILLFIYSSSSTVYNLLSLYHVINFIFDQSNKK